MNAYKKFAYYYDTVMSSLEYDLWVEFVEPYLTPTSSLLDLACGSGTFLTMLYLKGYSVEGLDLSEEIIDIAKEKAKINHFSIPFYVEDMTQFNLNKTYDVITCFFDSVNFLKTDQQIQDLFDHVYSHLNPNGYFIMDVFSKTLFNAYSLSSLEEDYETSHINWKTNKEEETTLKHTITIIEGDLNFKEIYFEYYHEIKSLKHTRFKLLKMSGDFNDDVQLEDERILLVFQAL